MRKISLFLLVSFVFIFIGCGGGEDSEDVNQDRIYTDYEVFYNANEDKTHVIARFRFGNALGTLLELTEESGASVTFNGDTLAYSSLWGGHHREYAGNTTSGTFVYTNTEDTVYTNSTPMGTSIEFPDGITEIDRSEAQTIAWVGDPLAADDQVGIFIGSWEWGDNALFWTDEDGATEIVMGINLLENLELGAAAVYMDRWNAVDVTEGTSAGGTIRYKYRATNVTVTVVDSSEQ